MHFAFVPFACFARKSGGPALASRAGPTRQPAVSIAVRLAAGVIRGHPGAQARFVANLAHLFGGGWLIDLWVSVTFYFALSPEATSQGLVSGASPTEPSVSLTQQIRRLFVSENPEQEDKAENPDDGREQNEDRSVTKRQNDAGTSSETTEQYEAGRQPSDRLFTGTIGLAVGHGSSSFSRFPHPLGGEGAGAGVV